MKYISLFFISVFVGITTSCKQEITKQELSALNGYWEIEKVTTAEGQVKEYKINTTVDYIQLEENEKGFRKKVYPNLNGRYQTSDNAEFFTLKKNTDTQWEIIYQTNENTWTEILTSISANHFQVLNQAGVTYHYKRWQSFDLQQ
ncbi:hypothetical protein [Capnocytophaga canimorsus]|uniref:Uncharacterized protein n=2 Tax=Capnocytophaga canimorsus TaxID=28188 RepID=A0A0B7HCI1_9FLAO|nr:hypothetical protein [Capnocytophaga canimorsus]ATA76541.1 hypothetical protein CGC47_02530 [Capnocytophaga canimorsus]AWL77955.1 hypothetical protein DKB58_02805 [Capnocytophaga canimorsus]AYW36584.1 hypothetical protein D8L92_04205 [Capnocytophaga canimorsus]MDT9499201.1 hypothetical protein [Capnocytophaga canimorsus]PJI77304.1 hypothetical protein CLV61_1632 [Capnocytophaga canimorsus]